MPSIPNVKNCNDNYKCIKCGEGHSIHLCEKPKITPSRYANCAGEQLSISLRRQENPYNATFNNKRQKLQEVKNT